MHGTVFYGALQRFGDTKKTLVSAYGLFCAVFIPFALILFFLLPFSSLPKELIPVLVAQIFVDTTVTFFLSKYRYRYRYKVYVSINIIISALTYIISLILITLFDLREMGRMYGMLFAALPFAALFFVNIISSFKNLYDKHKEKENAKVKTLKMHN
jgi:FlaA1/EpsC-like NDP-sugar epimerase